MKSMPHGAVAFAGVVPGAGVSPAAVPSAAIGAQAPSDPTVEGLIAGVRGLQVSSGGAGLIDQLRGLEELKAAGLLQAIPPALHRVHGAKDETEKALHSGAYSLGGPDRLAAFIEEDAAFHDELVTLLRASRANDLEAATRQVGVIMNGCTSCHVKFRF